MVGQRQKVPFKYLVSTVTCRSAFLVRRRIWTVSFMYFIPSNHNKILLKWLMCFIQKKKKKSDIFLLYQELYFPSVFLNDFSRIKPQGLLSEGLNTYNSHWLQLQFCFEHFWKSGLQHSGSCSLWKTQGIF